MTKINEETVPEKNYLFGLTVSEVPVLLCLEVRLITKAAGAWEEDYSSHNRKNAETLKGLQMRHIL